MGRETEEQWRKRVERWKDSGLTAAEYAAETGLNRHTLTYWNWRLKAQQGNSRVNRTPRKTGAPKTAPAKFVEVKMPIPELAAASEAAEPLELWLGDRMRLRIPARFDEHALVRVVAVLAGR